MTEERKVDWGRPIEAVDGNGRAWKAQEFSWYPAPGFTRWVMLPDSMQKIPCDEDGNTGGLWHIRNVAQPTLPDDLTARMVALVKRMAGRVDRDGVPSEVFHDYDQARAIVAEIEPVDGDLIEAREIVAQQYEKRGVRSSAANFRAGISDNTFDIEVALAIKRGRALERGEG